MRFNPIEFFYELFNGNPYVVTVMILSVIIALIPDSLVYFIKDIPSKIKIYSKASQLIPLLVQHMILSLLMITILHSKAGFPEALT